MNPVRVLADFNGLFGHLLCLSHDDFVDDEAGNLIILSGGMRVIAFEPDIDDAGAPSELSAHGVVEPSPDWLACAGSKWSLRIDEHGFRYGLDESARAPRVDPRQP
jgi:hypothetical protein